MSQSSSVSRGERDEGRQLSGLAAGTAARRAGGSRFRLSPRWRKGALLLHILASVGWFGIAAATLVLTLSASGQDDPEVVRAAYRFHEQLVDTIARPAALATLGTGLVLSFGTPWGLTRYYWPLAKFVLTIATILITVLLSPAWISTAIAQADAVELGELSTVQNNLVGMAVFHLVTIGLAAGLAIYKPGGRIRRGNTSATAVRELDPAI